MEKVYLSQVIMMNKYTRIQVMNATGKTYSYLDENNKRTLCTEENLSYVEMPNGFIIDELKLNVLTYGSEIKYFATEDLGIEVLGASTEYNKLASYQLGNLSIRSNINISDEYNTFDPKHTKSIKKITVAEVKKGKRTLELDFYKFGDKIVLDADEEFLNDYEEVYNEYAELLQALEENKHEFNMVDMLIEDYKARKHINKKDIKKLAYAVIGRYYVGKLINEEKVFDKALEEIETVENIILNTEGLDINKRVICNCQNNRKLELNIKK